VGAVHVKRGERSRTDYGAAAVEFALVCIIFLTLVFGIIQYSMYFWSTQSGSAAAREAARRAAVGDQSCAALNTAAQSNVQLEAGTVTATRQYYAVGDDSFSAAIAPTVGSNVRVTISYDVIDFGFPFIPFASGAVSTDAVARVENTTPSSVPCT
jgi:Flp pilus assembly protein TadG